MRIGGFLFGVALGFDEVVFPRQFADLGDRCHWRKSLLGLTMFHHDFFGLLCFNENNF